MKVYRKFFVDEFIDNELKIDFNQSNEILTLIRENGYISDDFFFTDTFTVTNHIKLNHDIYDQLEYDNFI